MCIFVFMKHGNTWKLTRGSWNCANIFKLVRRYFALRLFNQKAFLQNPVLCAKENFPKLIWTKVTQKAIYDKQQWECSKIYCCIMHKQIHRVGYKKCPTHIKLMLAYQAMTPDCDYFPFSVDPLNSNVQMLWYSNVEMLYFDSKVVKYILV